MPGPNAAAEESSSTPTTCDDLEEGEIPQDGGTPPAREQDPSARTPLPLVLGSGVTVTMARTISPPTLEEIEYQAAPPAPRVVVAQQTWNRVTSLCVCIE